MRGPLSRQGHPIHPLGLVGEDVLSQGCGIKRSYELSRPRLIRGFRRNRKVRTNRRLAVDFVLNSEYSAVESSEFASTF